MMHESVARGRNFEVGPNEARIFHATARRTDRGYWVYKDMLVHECDGRPYNGELPIDENEFLEDIERYLTDIEAMGEIEQVKLLVVSPVAALALHATGVLKPEYFNLATERSSAYFDIPTSEFGDSFVLRVAQNPENPVTATDHRGYPIVES